MKRTVLDASAVICFFEGRKGGEVVESLVMEAIGGTSELLMSAVNWGEVYYTTWRTGGEDTAKRIAAEISQFPIRVIDATTEIAKTAAELRVNYQLPYADCFAAALSKIHKAGLLTSDRDFAAVHSEVDVQFL